MLARVRKWFDGAGLFVGGAVVLFAVALLAVLLGLQSPDRVLWTGQQVTGTEHGGIVTYGWHGQSYSLDVPGFGSSKCRYICAVQQVATNRPFCSRDSREA